MVTALSGQAKRQGKRMTYQTGTNRFSDGRIALALLASLAIFMTFAFAVAPVRAVSEQCPDGGTTVESLVDGDLDDIVLDAGTAFCVKAGTEASGQMTADGTTTLGEYVALAGILVGSGNTPNVSHYTVYGVAGDDDDDDDDDTGGGGDDDDDTGDDDDDDTGGGGGQADCPAGPTFVLNFDGTVFGTDGDTHEAAGLIFTFHTDEGEGDFLTVENTNDFDVYVAVKGGPDMVGNATLVEAGATEVIAHAPDNENSGKWYGVSNVSICTIDVPGDDDDDDDDDDTGGGGDDDDDDDEGTAGGNPPGGEGTLGGNPSVPNTAMSQGTDTVVPTLVALIALSMLGALASLRLAESRRRS